MQDIGKDKGFEIRWRAESSRDFDTVRKQGMGRQSKIEALKTKTNMDKAWHPFSKPAISDKCWYRKASSDNDWYTVVSVASDWRTSLAYPKIGQTPELRILGAGAVPDTKLQLAHPDLIGDVEFMDGTKGLRLITRSKIFLMLIDTMYFDTKKKQGERGRLGLRRARREERGWQELPGSGGVHPRPSRRR